jgi:lysophospholipase L1-like esterase
LERVHRELPQTRVLINSVKIAASRANQIPQVHELNARLQAWAKNREWARYIDTTAYLADDQGQPIAGFYRKDRLHLNDEGYRRWKAILEPVLREEWAKASAP